MVDRGSWQDLPGTLEEIKAISKMYKDVTMLTGKKAAESEVKGLSRSGMLRKYQVIHFATHGISVPEVPELSALVLTQSGEKQGTEDGYLQMQEIAGLKLKADFVNLSACETGLGRLYGGEGVVGLTQAFLVAGANGLSVSLWQVADKSTMKFMVELYRLVKEDKLSYAEAISQVKREFIAGEYGKTYQAPFYWAPFVYYGK